MCVGDGPVREIPLAGRLGHVVEAVGDGFPQVVSELARHGYVWNLSRVGDLPQRELPGGKGAFEVLADVHRLRAFFGASGKGDGTRDQQYDPGGFHVDLSFRG